MNSGGYLFLGCLTHHCNQRYIYSVVTTAIALGLSAERSVYTVRYLTSLYEEFWVYYDHLFQWFYFEFQQLYSQCQESNDLNIKPVTVKEVVSILYLSETSLRLAAPHLTHLHNFLYIRLSENHKFTKIKKMGFLKNMPQFWPSLSFIIEYNPR